jgi:PhnB protein
MSSLIPYLSVNGAAAAIDFYQRAFGAQELSRHKTPDGAKIMHAALSFPGGGTLMLSDDFPEHNNGKRSSPEGFGGSPVTLHLTLPHADPVWDAAVAAGATVTMPLADQFWGDRYGRLRDPFGHEWSLSSPKNQPSEAEVLEGAKQHFPPQT